tara:strand:- start:1539 stop:2612 length:1074 start_codon:yes stop_codon:yes gene_type:complete
MLSRLSISIWLFICCSVFLVGCGSSDEDGKKAVVRPVKLMTIGQDEAVENYRFPAVIDAFTFANLSFQVGGKLKQFPVKPAQDIEQGQLIAQLDQRDFKSALASAKATYDKSKKELERATTLVNQQAISRSTYDRRKADNDVSKSQLEQAQKALEDSTINAPFDGVIAETLVENFQSISPGETIVKYMQNDLLKATIDLPAKFVARLTDKKPDKTEVSISVVLDAAPDQPIDAEYEEAVLIADASSQTYAVTFTFVPPTTLTVLPGMNATIELQRRAGSQFTNAKVPLAAVTTDGENKYVWLVDEKTMRVKKQIVKVKDSVGQSLVVTEGLKGGDVIVGAGSAYVSEGMQVRDWGQE